VDFRCVGFLSSSEFSKLAFNFRIVELAYLQGFKFKKIAFSYLANLSDSAVLRKLLIGIFPPNVSNVFPSPDGSGSP
jgi:hypothetical protein